MYERGGSDNKASITRAEGNLGVCDFNRGSLSRSGSVGRRDRAPPMDVRCGSIWEGVGVDVSVVEEGRSVDDRSRLRFTGVAVFGVCGRGGGCMGISFLPRLGPAGATGSPPCASSASSSSR